MKGDKMFTTDVLIALWAITLCIGCAYAYFKGAECQLRECVRYRHSGCWMSDEEWMNRADISKRRTFPRENH